MQGNTHRVGGALCAVGGYMYLQSRGLLPKDMSPMLQLAIIYPFAIYGSIFPDIDHAWPKSPAKDPISFVMNKSIHIGDGNLLNARHRSWQTHSFILPLISLIIYWIIQSRLVLQQADGMILNLILLGFLLGVISHFILDMLTPGGIVLIIPSLMSHKRQTFKLVPKTEFFITGGKFETFVRWMMCLCLIVLIILIIIG